MTCDLTGVLCDGVLLCPVVLCCSVLLQGDEVRTQVGRDENLKHTQKLLEIAVTSSHCTVRWCISCLAPCSEN